MRELNLLSEEITHRLAAGEVVERPASCLKEVIENSIDANATLIDIKLEKGGIKKIEVYDNGKGIHSEDIPHVFERHTTSKIKAFDDIFKIKTMGFRGEALCAISSISKVTLISRHFEESMGSLIRVEGGKIILKKEYPFEKGTKIIVEDLFFNTPARLKFLKASSTEQKYCVEIVEKMAICYPEVSFRLEVDQKKSIFTPGDNKFESTIMSLFGMEMFNNLIDFHYEDNNLKIYGYFVNPAISKSTRNGYYFYVNRRYIRSKVLTSCVDEVFKNSIMTNRYPIIFLFIQINPEDVDVNVHPAKLEVKFRDERYIYNTVYKAINSALTSDKMIVKTAPKGIDKEDDIKKNLSNAHSELRPLVSSSSQVEEIIQKGDYQTDNFELKTQVNEQLEFPIIDKNKINLEIFTAVNTENKLESYKIVGYIFDTYIIVERGDSIYLIDQHAVHERSLFNRLKEELSLKKLSRQVLFSPIILELPMSQKEFVFKNVEVFENLGFEIDEFGKNEVLVRTIPAIFQNSMDKSFILDIIDLLYNETQKQGFVDFSEDLLKEIACKAAIKGNMDISDYDKERIVKMVLIDKEIFNCPHGRPVIVEIEKKEIEKMFKRIL